MPRGMKTTSPGQIVRKLPAFASASSFDTDVAFKDPATCRLPTGTLNHYDRTMALSDRQLLDSLSRMPFVDSAELALILGEPHATVHRALTGLLADDVVGRVSHGTAHLPSSHRYYLTANGIRDAAQVLDFDTPSDFVRAYPMSREWLALLTRRMDAVASVYRLAASLSPSVDGLRSHVEFHRRGRFDATITPHRRYIITPPFMLMFSDSVLPNWPAKMSDYGDIDVDSEGAGKNSGAQQLTGRAHDPGPGGNPHGSERTPHQAHPGGL